MKILHVIPSLSPVRGGTSRAAIDMVRALIDRGIDVEIATTNDDGDNLLDVALGCRISYEGVPTYFFPRFSPSIHPVREFAFSGALTAWLWQQIGNYDLVHVHALFSYASTLAMAVARLQNVPYLVTPHGLLCEWSLQQGNSKKQAYLKAIERANLDRAAAIHLTCQQERDDLTRLGLRANTHTIPLGLTQIPPQLPHASELLRQTLNLAADEPIILFLSRLHYKKGLEYLIAALGRLHERRFTLLIAGSGTPQYEAEIRARLAIAGIVDRTQMVGFVEGERKDLLIQGSDLFALTSHSENFGISVLEALAVGTPVLVTPGVGLATVVRDADLGYVADLNVEAIAATLDRFFAEPEHAQHMGMRARELTMAQYTWDKIAKEIVRVYQNLSN